MIFESHAHYDDEAFDKDRDELLFGMPDAGIGGIVNVGASLQGVAATVKLMEQYSFIYGALGIHPDEVGSLNSEALDWLKELLVLEKAVAVGEIGLDYYWDKESHERQKKGFGEQLQLSKEVKLPVVIHSREAARDTLEMIKSEHAGSTGGVIHCFSNSKEMAREYLNLRYYLGVGGVVTFKNARVLKEVVEYTPLDRILVETDCPYLAPAPYRGKRNSSLYIPYILEEIARIKKITPEEAEQATFKNAMQMYHIAKRNLPACAVKHAQNGGKCGKTINAPEND